MMKKILGGVFVVAILAIGGYFLFSNNQATSPGENTLNQEATQTQQPSEEANSNLIEVQVETAKTHEVVYTDTGFAPSALTIKVGDTVTFKNQGSAGMWVASAMHPSHMGYSGTDLQGHCPDAENNDFDQCQIGAAGTSWSFTFTKTGAFGYHNHSNSKHFGKVTVE